MQTNIFHNLMIAGQNEMFSDFTIIANKDVKTARFLAIPVAVLDSLIPVLISPFSWLEKLTSLAMNFFGGILQQEGFTIRQAINDFQHLFSDISSYPVTVATFPLKALYQIFAMLISPTTASSFNENNNQTEFSLEESIIWP